MDTLVTVPHFPTEDTKLRANGTKLAGGGPTATGLVAAAKLGEKAGFIGVLSNDSAGQFLLTDFVKYGVGTERSVEVIELAEKNGILTKKVNTKIIPKTFNLSIICAFIFPPNDILLKEIL